MDELDPKEDAGTTEHPRKGLTRLLKSYADYRKRHPDEMERLVQEARDADLLHGKLGRKILRNYELHKSLRWGRRTDVILMVGIVILVPAALLNVPQPILIGLLIVWLLAGAATVIAMVITLVQGYTIRAVPPPSSNHAETPAVNEDSQQRDL